MVMERDHISEEYFFKRDARSIDYSPYHFDFVLFNDYTKQAMNHMLASFDKQKDGEEK